MLVVKATVFFFFFRTVSHQLNGGPNHHLLIRQAEHFIESNTENSWNEYINMSIQGTWCDALFAQVVADCQNVAIHIIESRENFPGETLIFSATSTNNNIETTPFKKFMTNLRK